MHTSAQAITNICDLKFYRLPGYFRSATFQLSRSFWDFDIIIIITLIIRIIIINGCNVLQVTVIVAPTE